MADRLDAQNATLTPDHPRLPRRRGATALGYSLILGLIGVISIASVEVVGIEVTRLFGLVDTSISDGETPPGEAATFTFDDSQGLPGRLVTSAANTLAVGEAPVTVSLDGGTNDAALIIDGEAAGTDATLQPGQSLALRERAPAVLGESVSLTLGLGTDSLTWQVTAATPVAFAPLDPAPPESPVESSTETVTGLDAPVSISVDNDASDAPVMYAIGSGAFTDQPGTIASGQTLRLQTTSGPADGTIHRAVVLFDGDVPVSWEVVSEDRVPLLDVADLNPVPVNRRLALGPYQPSDFDGALDLSLATSDGTGNPAWALNGAADPGLNPGTGSVSTEDALGLYLTTVDAALTTRILTVTLGGVDFPVTLTTGNPDDHRITVPPVDNAVGESLVISDPVTPLPYALAQPVSVSDASGTALVSVDGGTTWASEVMYGAGDSLLFQVMAGPETGAEQLIDIDFAGVTSQWSVTAPDVTPEAVFEATFGHAVGEDAISNSVQFNGITAPVTVTAGVAVDKDGTETGPGTVSLDGETFSASVLVPVGGLLQASQLIPQTAQIDDPFTLSMVVTDSHGTERATLTWRASAGGNDKLPEGLTVPDTLDVEPAREASSASVTLDGFNAEADIVLIGADGTQPRLSIDNRAFVDAGEGTDLTIRPGQPFRLQALAPADLSSEQTLTLRVGDLGPGTVAGVDFLEATWRMTTRDTDLNPDAGFRFADVTGAGFQEIVLTPFLSPTGFSAPIEFRLSGPDVDLVEASITGVPRAPVPPDGLVGMISQGQTIQLQMVVDIADGDPKLVDVQVGDASYTWRVDTVDMYPDPFPPVELQVFPPQSLTFLRRDDNGDGEAHLFDSSEIAFLERTVTGIDPAVELDTLGQLLFDERNARRNVVRNGEILRFRGRAGNAGQVVVREYNLGGRIIPISFEAVNDPSIPRQFFIEHVDDAPLNTRVCSPFVQPLDYGSQMDVTITAGESFADLETDDGQVGDTVVVDTGTLQSVRICAETGTESVRTVTYEYLDSPNDGGRTTGVLRFADWIVRTVSAPAPDKRPDPFAILSGGVPKTDWVNNNPTTDSLRLNFSDIAVGTTTLRGYEGPIQVWIVQNSGEPERNNAGIEILDIFGGPVEEVTISPGQGVRVKIGGSVPGEAYSFTTFAGDRSDPAQQESFSFTVTAGEVDNDPDPASLVFASNSINVAPNLDTSSPRVQPQDYLYELLVSVSGDPSARLQVNGRSAIGPGETEIMRAGDDLRLIVLAGPPDGSTKTLTLTVEGQDDQGNDVTYTSNWSATTVDRVINPISFTAVTGAEPGSFADSNQQTIAGISEPVTLTIAGDGNPQFQVIRPDNSSTTFATSHTVEAGDRVALQLLPTAFGTTYTATLSGPSGFAAPQTGTGGPVSWSVTTRAAPTYGWVAVGTANRTLRYSSCSGSATDTWTCTASSGGARSGTAGPGDQIAVSSETPDGRVASFHGFSNPSSPTVGEGTTVSGFSGDGDTIISVARGATCSSDTTATVTATIYECRQQ